MDIRVTRTATPKQKPQDESKLGFGRIFTDHMFTVRYTDEDGWHDAQIVPYGPFSLDPATCVFHYSQEIFEGLKAYSRQDGKIGLFRPEDNFRRMNVSAERMAMPTLPVADAMQALRELLAVDADWTPTSPGTSLYIRPTMIGTDPILGVHASHSYLFYIILCPVGAYYPSGFKPISIYVESEYVRAVRGGVGFTKTGGNYAAQLLANTTAQQKGFTQVLWLDAIEHRYIEEVGAMNMCFIIGDELITPPLGGSILPGITRDSVLKLAPRLGLKPVERAISIDEVMEAAQSGALTESFGVGTAAVVSPVGVFQYKDKRVEINGNEVGPRTQRLYDTLTGIQYGRIADDMGWTVTL